MAVFQLNDGRWIVHYKKGTNPEAPNRTREYFGRGSKAERAALERNKALGFGRRKTKPKPTGPLFSDLAADYLQCKSSNANSRKHLSIRLSANLLPFFGHKAAVQLTHLDVDRYVKKRRGTIRTVLDRTKLPKTATPREIERKARRLRKPIKYATIARELTDLKAILNWATRQKPPLIPFNPIRDYQKPKPERVDILPPTKAETKAILAASPPHLVRFIKLSYYLGLRPGAVELLRLTWDAVNWESWAIEVISAEKGGMERRWVPIHAGFREELRGWWKADKRKGPIIHYRKKPIRKIQTTWENTLVRAGIKRRLRPYDMRHLFVTATLEKGADIGAVAAVVGSSPETLRRHYQHVTNRLRRQVVDAIDPLG